MWPDYGGLSFLHRQGLQCRHGIPKGEASRSFRVSAVQQAVQKVSRSGKRSPLLDKEQQEAGRESKSKNTAVTVLEQSNPPGICF